MDFSSGGHLVTTIAAHFDTDFTGQLAAANLRPDFLVAVYPVISMSDKLTHTGSRYNLFGKKPSHELLDLFSNELQVSDSTPPAYLVSAIDYPVVKVENTLQFSAALRQHRVHTDVLLYAKGGHGFGADNSLYKTQWTDACIDWIKKLHNERNRKQH